MKFEKEEPKNSGAAPADQSIQNGSQNVDDNSLSSPDRREFLVAGGVIGATMLAGSQVEAQAVYSPNPPPEVPAEYTAPSETLKPGIPDGDYYVPSTEKDVQVRWWMGRNVGGVTIGLVQLRAHLPMAPGNMGNATTFKFPLLYREMLPENPYDIMALEPADAFVDEIVKAANWLELQGVRAIMGNCGFFGTYQEAVAERINTPFYSSSLLQLPAMLRSLPQKKKIAVITANGPVLEAAPALEKCGVTPQEIQDRIIIKGLEEGPEMKKVLNLVGEYNMLLLEQEIVAAARSVVDENPDVGSILLECTELSPAAHAVQDAVRLPVWDYTTLTKWIHEGCLRWPFFGVI